MMFTYAIIVQAQKDAADLNVIQDQEELILSLTPPLKALGYRILSVEIQRQAVTFIEPNT